MQRFDRGLLHIGDGGFGSWDIPPVEVTSLGFQLLSGVPDQHGYYSPNEIWSSNSVSMSWYTYDATPGTRTRIYRQVMNIDGVCTPSCDSFALIAEYDNSAIGLGQHRYRDTNAVPNARNCYHIVDYRADGTERAWGDGCAFTRDGRNHRPGRLQLAIRVGGSQSDTTEDPVFARLQHQLYLPQRHP